MVQRVKAVKKLADHVSTKNGRAFPTYSCANAIRGELLRMNHVAAISKRTVCRDLRRGGYVNRVRPCVPTRVPEQLEAKQAFARRMKKLGSSYQHRIIFSDESWLCTNEGGHRTCWVPRGVKPLPRERKCRWNCASSVLVWACIGRDYKSELIVLPSKTKDGDGETHTFRLSSRTYIDKCLAKVVGKFPPKSILQQDNARAHVAAGTHGYLKRKGITILLKWPPYSCDLNVIEGLWAELQRRVGLLGPSNLAELTAAAKKAWNAIPMAMINSFIDGFAAKLERVLQT